jgi:phage shock protein PspC (stress-responsive transcriptional regulator)
MSAPAADRRVDAMSPSAEPRATMQDIWRTRPTRRDTDRKLAGVAAAVARRYDIDPVLVRIGFVVAAFYGIGVLLYLAAWLSLPPDPHDPPRGPLSRRRGGSAHPALIVVTVVAAIFTLSAMARGGAGTLVALAVTGGLLYLLHQNRGERGLASESARQAARRAGPAPEPRGRDAEDTVQAAEQRRPPAWDPLGAAPFAWDLPEPAAAPPAPPPARSVLTPVTIGLALLTAGAVAALAIVTRNPDGVRLVAGSMLAVIGIGLVVGAFRHRGRGLLLVAVPLLVVCWVASIAGPVQARSTGELRAAPVTAAQLQPLYQRDFGEVRLDLSHLNLTPLPAAATPAPATPAAPAEGPAAGAPTTPAAAPAVPGKPAQLAAPPTPLHTTIRLRAGQVRVTVPPTANVTVHCTAGVGQVRCLGEDQEGPGSEARVTQPAVGGAPTDRPLDIDIEVGAGRVEVARG